MTKKRKPESDVNETAFQTPQAVTGEPAGNSRNEKTAKKKNLDQPEKNPSTVALGRLGGLKGGKARAE